MTHSIEGHTPTPWEVDPLVRIKGYPDLPCIVDHHRLIVAQCLDDGHTKAECEANANLIVTAVNNHHALVEALDDLAVAAERSGEVGFANEIDAAFTALANVRGEKADA